MAFNIQTSAWQFIYSSSQLHLAPVRASAASRLRMLSRPVEGLRGLRHIQRRVLGEEAIRLEHNTDTLHGHDGEILNAGVMRETES